MTNYSEFSDDIKASPLDNAAPGMAASVDTAEIAAPTIPPAQIVESLLAFLEAAGDEMGLTLDRGTLRRNLSSQPIEDLNHGSLTASVFAAISRSAAAAQMRIDLLTLSPPDAVKYVRFGAPLGQFRTNDSGRLEWVLLAECRGRKLRTIDSTGNKPVWQRRSVFVKNKNAGSSEGASEGWIALQPLLSCEADESVHHSVQSPWVRYLNLLAPERSDMGVILVFAVLVGVLTLSTPIAVELLVNTVAFGQFLQPVIVLATLLFVFLAFGAVMRALQSYVAEIIQRRIFVRIAGDLAVRLPRVRYQFWTSHYGPELINRFFEVVTLQKVTTQLLLDGLALVLQALIGMAVIAFYHPILLGFDVVLIVLILGVIFVLGRGAVSTSIDESRQKYATAAWLEELARHPIAFRSTGGMSLALDYGDQAITSYLAARSSHFRILMRQTVASLALQVLASTVLLGLGGWLVIRGELTLGQLVAAELIVTVIVGSFVKIAKYLESYYDVLASVDKLGHLLDMPIEQSNGIDLPRKQTGIALTVHDLATSALPGGQQVRTNSIQIRPGERVAVVGPNASLRRSLLETIAGMQRPVSGHVEFDEFDSRRLRPASIFDQIAVVADPEIFEGTIAENIHLGRVDVSEADIRTALQHVGLLDELSDLPQGISSSIGTDGRQFSHEQLMRLMLARAIAAKPRLLLVDGAFDVLPDDTTATVIGRVLQALPSTTCIITTGRHTVANACERQMAINADGHVQDVAASRRRAVTTS